MINAIMKWARGSRPATFQARRLEAIGSGNWFPSRKILAGCGVNKLPSHHYGSADQVFSWLDAEMKNKLRLPIILVGKVSSGFYQMTDEDGAMGAPLGDSRICVFNSSETIDERREMLVFFHEAAHCLNLLWHDRFFLAMHLMLNYRSSVELTEREVGYDYCTQNDLNILSATDWALDYASQNWQKDLTAIELAMQLLILQSENLQ